MLKTKDGGIVKLNVDVIITTILSLAYARQLLSKGAFGKAIYSAVE